MKTLAENNILSKQSTGLLANTIHSDYSINTLPLTYFDLLDETPEYSEAAILLEDGTIEYCYIKLGRDGSQYFGFSYACLDSPEHGDIIARHKLSETMSANTFERYPSGKTILSKGGKILEISMPQRGRANV